MFSFIQAHFSHPMVAAAVIIHLAADGTGYLDQTQCNITVQLVDTKEGIHSLGENFKSQPTTYCNQLELVINTFHSFNTSMLFISLSPPPPPPDLLSTGEWRLSCRTNPLVIPVSHDLSVAFYHTKAILVMFASRLVAVSGVGLRSFQSFDPITISGCQSNEIYNPTGQR